MYGFLSAIVQSFKVFQRGEKLYDPYRKEYLNYKAHITHIIGDTPAISKMIGINSTISYRNCRIQFQKGSSSTNYPDLHLPNENATHTLTYNSLHLPVWENNSSKSVVDAINEGRDLT